MSMFRAKKLDLSCFVNTQVIRDHTKRKVFEQHEVERYVAKERQGLSTPITPHNPPPPPPRSDTRA